MSSTNINIGIFEGRNSSRVLKPPGGGHSQIFGAFEDEKPRPKIKHQNSTEINACFSHDPKIEKMEKIDVPKSIEIADEEKHENAENSMPETANDDIKQQQQAPTRVRVPPGGFSSGFW